MSKLTDELNALKRAERHATVTETRYWCEQYRLFAERAVAAVAAESERQEPVAGVVMFLDGPALVKRGKERDFIARNGGSLLYTTPPNIPVLERDRADAYEELRAIIDGGSESMTHADAVEWCKRHAESDWKPVKNNS